MCNISDSKKRVNAVALDPGSMVLDMVLKRDEGFIHLVVLSDDGKQLILPTYEMPGHGSVEIKEVIRSLTCQAHHDETGELTSFKRGCITSIGATIASTTGTNVAVRGVGANQSSELFVQSYHWHHQ